MYDPLVKVNKLTRVVTINESKNIIKFAEVYEIINESAGITDGITEDLLLRHDDTFQGHIITELYMNVSPNTGKIYCRFQGKPFLKRLAHDILLVEPHFPIYGQDQFNLTLAWTTHLDQYLQIVGDEYFLTLPILFGPRHCVYDEIELNIFLRAENISELSTNFGATGIIGSWVYGVAKPKAFTKNYRMTLNNKVSNMNQVLTLRYR
jgi:oligosaccharyltransferase complex subunit alpha (ribophorin I)